jgi:spermidine/putrescine transport system permease protein
MSEVLSSLKEKFDWAEMLLFLIALGSYGLLYTPAVIMGLMSFNASTMPIFPFKGFTLYWYKVLFQNEFLLNSLKNSLIVGLPSAAIATVLGTMAAFALVRHRFKGRNITITFALLPFIMPRLILAVGLLCFFSLLGIKGSLLFVIIGHIMLTIPISVLFIMARLIRFPPNIEDAAANLGASPRKVFQCITLPILMPSITASFFFSFCTSFDEVLIAFFTTGKDNTLPIHIWATLSTRLSTEMVAMASLLSLLTACITALMWVIIARPQKRR